MVDVARERTGIDAQRVLEIGGSSMAYRGNGTADVEAHRMAVARGEVPDGQVVVKGITVWFVFDRARLESHRADVAGMLANLPRQFRLTEGGGWSFLNGCMDGRGRQWTDSYRFVETLMQLGIALGLGRWTTPRETWATFPGGMPYYVIDDTLPEFAVHVSDV
jgi:hypothetical protein